MIKAASQSFRQHGFDGIGVDGLADSAGVTSGAFYSHFGSKNGAFQEGLIAGLDEAIETIPAYQEEYGENWIRKFTDYYMGQAHREDLACGCAMAALTTEVIRQDVEVHEIFEEKMRIITSLIAKGLAGKSEKQKLGRAWSMMSILTGGLNFARAVNSQDTIKHIVSNTKSSAIAVAGETQKVQS